jgi:hypothetical protein
MDDKLIVDNNNNAKFVLLLPLRNVNKSDAPRLKILIQNINKSFFDVIILIIKFQDQDLIDIFTSHLDSKFKIHLLIRPRNENMFDSQKMIILKENMWILQLHDDDFIEFKTDLRPNFVDPYTVGVPKIENMHNVERDNANPNSYVFSLIPSYIWNMFTEYLRKQNSHVSDSSDIILSELISTIGKIEKMVSIKYIYNNRNWYSPKSRASRNHGTELCQRDQWGIYSSPYLLSATSKMELLFFLLDSSFIYEPRIFNQKIYALVDNMRNSFRFILLWKIINIFTFFCKKFIFRKMLNRFKFFQFIMILICKFNFISEFILSFRNLDSIYDIERLLKIWYSNKKLEPLFLRFRFWIDVSTRS